MRAMQAPYLPAGLLRTALVLTGMCGLLSACGPGENEPGPGDVTVGEARALGEAAAMLDARRSPLDGTAVAPAPLPPAAPSSAAPSSAAPVPASPGADATTPTSKN